MQENVPVICQYIYRTLSKAWECKEKNKFMVSISWYEYRGKSYGFFAKKKNVLVFFSFFNHLLKDRCDNDKTLYRGSKLMMTKSLFCRQLRLFHNGTWILMKSTFDFFLLYSNFTRFFIIYSIKSWDIVENVLIPIRL